MSKRTEAIRLSLNSLCKKYDAQTELVDVLKATGNCQRIDLDNLDRERRQLQANFDSLTRENRRVRADNSNLLGEKRKLVAELLEVSEAEMQSPAMSVTHMRTKIKELHAKARAAKEEYGPLLTDLVYLRKENKRLIQQGADQTLQLAKIRNMANGE